MFGLHRCHVSVFAKSEKFFVCLFFKLDPGCLLFTFFLQISLTWYRPSKSFLQLFKRIQLFLNTLVFHGVSIFMYMVTHEHHGDRHEISVKSRLRPPIFSGWGEPAAPRWTHCTS